MNTDQTIRNYALQNALKFKGKANSGALVGKILGEFPEWRLKQEELIKKIKKIVDVVNSLSVEEQRSELEQNAPDLLDEKKKRKKQGLPDLDDTKEVVMRFAPSPSGPLHVGHAYVLSLNSEFCRKYNGKLYIRIEDTNPENINPESYKLIEEDAQWLTRKNVEKVIIQSERLDIYYKYAEQMIKKGNAYICICDSEKFRELITKQIACPCRNGSVEEHLKRYKKLFKGYKEGEAVMRIKTDVEDKNPAMRDWPAMRIKEHEHPKTKTTYRVWPLLNFAVAIDDHDMGITHTIRAKDHMDNEKRQKFIYDYFGWTMPHHLYVGRINFKDLRISSTETRKMIESGKYEGWDDIRLPFIRALKRRGYVPDTFIKYALDVGVTQNDKYVTEEEFFKTINAFNKECIDAEAHRFFFIHDPVEIKVRNAPQQSVELDLHPDSIKGGRPFHVHDLFYLSKKDMADLNEGDIVRLMDLFNIKKKNDLFVFESKEYQDYKSKGKKIIHWLPKEETIQATVKMPDGSIVQGIAEKNMKETKVNDIIQLERFGFCRVDKKGETIDLWYAHK